MRCGVVRGGLTGAGFHAGVPLAHGDFVFADGERLVDGDQVGRLLGLIDRAAAHREHAARQGNQPGALRAVLELAPGDRLGVRRRRVVGAARRRLRAGFAQAGRNFRLRALQPGGACGRWRGRGGGRRRSLCCRRGRRRVGKRCRFLGGRAQAGDARLRQRHETPLRIGLQVGFEIAGMVAVVDRFPKSELELFAAVFRHHARKLDRGRAALHAGARRISRCHQYANDHHFLPHLPLPVLPRA